MRPKQSYGSGRDALKGLSSVPRADGSWASKTPNYPQRDRSDRKSRA